MINLAILISGRGSNMEAILKSIKKNKIPINPAVVISNKPDAKGIKIAQKLGVSTEIVESRGIKGASWKYDHEIVTVLEKYGVTSKNGLVCLAGFMRIMSPEFIKQFKGKIINIHPALLPAFPGLHSQKQAIDYGVKYAGCTVHFVDEGIDTGPIILQSVIKIDDNDSEDTLSKRILAREHIIYPKAIKLFVEGKIITTGRKTRISRIGSSKKI